MDLVGKIKQFGVINIDSNCKLFSHGVQISDATSDIAIDLQI